MSKGQGVLAPRDLQRKLAKRIDTDGLQKVVQATGVSREALCRLAAGLTVRPGTIALVEAKLAEGVK